MQFGSYGYHWGKICTNAQSDGAYTKNMIFIFVSDKYKDITYHLFYTGYILRTFVTYMYVTGHKCASKLIDFMLNKLLL